MTHTISFFSKVFLTLDGCGAPSTGCCLASPEAIMLEQPAEDAPVQNTLEAGKRGWLGGCNACEHLAHTRPPKCTQSNPHTPRTNQAVAPKPKMGGKSKAWVGETSWTSHRATSDATAAWRRHMPASYQVGNPLRLKVQLDQMEVKQFRLRLLGAVDREFVFIYIYRERERERERETRESRGEETRRDERRTEDYII